jgi:hypothetical protein
MADDTNNTILEAVLISSRVQGNDIEVDIKSNILELKTFENISKPWIDAQLVFIDDFGLKDAVSIAGTEKFRIVLGNPNDPQGEVFTKFFFISQINDSQRQNDNAEIISVSLVEDQLYVDSVKEISRSFTGNIEDIITNICNVELGKEVERFVNKVGSAQGTRKIIVPYMSPLSAVQWILTRATTRIGGPLYLYSTLYSNALLLSDFDGLMQAPIFNKKFPLRYSDAGGAIEEKDERLRPYFQILSYREQNGDNLMAQMENGNVGSMYTNVDAGNGLVLSDHISIRDIVDEFYTNDILDPNTAQTMFDPSLLIGDKLADEYNSANIFQVTSGGTYNQFLGYHDEAVLTDVNGNLIESRLKVKNKIIRAILKKNIIDIGIDGRLIIESKCSVGARIRVLFLSTKPEASDEATLYDRLDKKKSGDYLVMAVQNYFRQENHAATLRLAKIGDIPEDAEI